MRIGPANQASWADVEAILGTADYCGRCRAVTCLVVRRGFRGRGLTYSLAAATVGYARERGARALEAYPMITQPGKEITWGEKHAGARQVFADAGFTEVSRPTVRRVVMRVDFDEAGGRFVTTAAGAVRVASGNDC